ncbi:MAG: hypothetical protein N3F10_03970 [Candidatus Bathyarchaeota archaeon]|nr:hypothetical protein [Candidatus Bathyarchaeota archaeon]
MTKMIEVRIVSGDPVKAYCGHYLAEKSISIILAIHIHVKSRV